MITKKEKHVGLRGRLVTAMGEMVNPTKSKKATVPTKSGGQYSYNYESLDQVLAVVRPPLTDQGIGLTQKQVWSENTSSYALQTIVFDDEETLLLDERPMRDCPDAQAAGSWETYMRRYALRSVFGLAGEDDDGQATLPLEQRLAAHKAKKAPGKWDKFKALKAEAVSLGIKEEAIKAWMEATITENGAAKDMKRYTPGDVNVCEGHVQILIDDMKAVRAKEEASQDEG